MSVSKSENPVASSDMQDFFEIKLKRIWKYIISERLSFWGISLYLFFEYVRPQNIYPVLDIAPWGTLSLSLAIIGAVIDPKTKWVRSSNNSLLIAYFLVIILSGFFAFSPQATWSEIKIFINWFLFYFLCITIINSEKRFFLFLIFFFLFSFKMSQNGFLTWASRGFSFTGWGLVGGAGWFKNSGEFAIQMVIFLSASAAFVLGLRQYWKRWWIKYFFYLMPFTAAFSVMGASSRGSQLAIAAIGLWLVLRSKQRFKVLLGIAIFGALLYHFLPPEQLARFEEMGTDDTSVQRLMYWSLGLDVVAKFPVLGIGYYNWLDYMLAQFPEGIGPLQLIELPHNIFIQAAAELGVIGFTLFILMILSTLRIGYKTRKMAKKLESQYYYFLALGLDCGLIGFLVAGFFVTVLYYPFFWVQMALIVALNNVVRKRYREFQSDTQVAG